MHVYGAGLAGVRRRALRAVRGSGRSMNSSTRKGKSQDAQGVLGGKTIVSASRSACNKICMYVCMYVDNHSIYTNSIIHVVFTFFITIVLLLYLHVCR